MVKQKIEPIGFEECVKEYFEAEKYLATDLEVHKKNCSFRLLYVCLLPKFKYVLSLLNRSFTKIVHYPMKLSNWLLIKSF